MEIEWKVEPGRREPKVTLTVGEDTPESRRLLRELRALTRAPISGWKGERSTALPQQDILRFYAENKGVVAQTETDTYEVKLRLYELEEVLDSGSFVRISNSEIVNLRRVTAVDLSMTGTIRMTLDHKVTAYVSRRYVKKIKETLKAGRRGSR